MKKTSFNTLKDVFDLYGIDRIIALSVFQQLFVALH